MSAIGPKRTSLAAPHMSALGGKADMTVCASPLFAVAIGGQSGNRFLQRICPVMTKADMTR